MAQAKDPPGPGNTAPGFVQSQPRTLLHSHRLSSWLVIVWQLDLITGPDVSPPGLAALGGASWLTLSQERFLAAPRAAGHWTLGGGGAQPALPLLRSLECCALTKEVLDFILTCILLCSSCSMGKRKSHILESK